MMDVDSPLLASYLLIGPLLIAAMLWPLAVLLRRQANQERRLAAIERRLELIGAGLGVAEPAPDLSEVLRLLRGNNLIAAIAAHRKATGSSLSEARDAVRRLQREQLG